MMLSPADQQIVQRDHRLPGLALLLDAEQFATRLGSLVPAAGIVSVEPRYLRYKSGTSCVAGYEVRGEVGTVFLYARAHDRDDSAKLQKAACRVSVPSALGSGITVWPDVAVVVYPFPNDHHLERLPSLVDPAARRELLERMLPEHPHAHDGSLATVRYKPERRFVGRLDSGMEAVAVLKMYTEDRYGAATRRQGRFESVGDVRVPAVIGRASKERVIALEWMGGRPIQDLLEIEGPGEAGCSRAGRALAGLHTQRPKLAEGLSCGDFVRSVEAAVDAVATVQPELADQLTPLQRRLVERLGRRPWRDRALHGDFSADQVLLVEDRVGVIDLDRACRGDPRVDLGSFVARLEHDAVVGRIQERRAEACSGALLEAYRTSTPRDLTGHVWLFVGACLLRLAPEPFRHRLPEWPAVTAAIVERAEELVRGAVRH